MSSIEGYSLQYDPRLRKAIQKNLPRDLKKVLDRKLLYLANNAHHPSLNTKQFNVSDQMCKQLGVDEIWEFYISMSYRCILYVLHEDKMLVIAYVGNHEDVKRKFG